MNIIKILIETHKKYELLRKIQDGKTLLHHAAFFGFEDAVKYLVKHHADAFLEDHHGDTLLMTALQGSSVNDLHPKASYRCYTTEDGQFRSCNTTCYDETIRYLIQSQRSRFSKCDSQRRYVLEQVIIKRMPLSLYALLKIGADSNCQFSESGLVVSLYLRTGGREVTKVLDMFNVDISLKCGAPFFESKLHQISFSIPPSLSNNHVSLQRLTDRHPKGVRILDECYDAEGYLPIHRAAQGGNLAAIKWFKSIGVNTQLKTRSGLTALDISLVSLQLSIETNWKDRHECLEELLRSFFDNSNKNYSSDFSSLPFSKYHILHSASRIGLDALKNLRNIAYKTIPGLEENRFLLLDQQDKNGNTPLHIAANKGREDVVKYLVGLGADTNVKNKEGNTPLMTALHVSSDNLIILNHDLNQNCLTTNDGLFTFCETTSHDEIVRYLLWLQKSSVSKCDGQSAYLLNQMIKKRLPLSLNALLKLGVELNCQKNEPLPPFLQHLRVGGAAVSEVLKIFEVDVSAKCLVPLSNSELHLISYVSTTEDHGNFFQPSLNYKRFPLQRLIDRHPKGVRILDECYDAEGYLPIHRAAQGGNLAAIKWFKSIGVNEQLKTRSGLTALDISILHLGDITYAELTAPSDYRFWHKSYGEIPVTTSIYRRQVFEELLRTVFSTTPEYRSGFPCGPTLEGLSPLHIAAVKGIRVLTYVHKKASEIFPSLPINCKNKHRLDPVYLANFYENIRKEGLKNEFPGTTFLLKLEEELRNKVEMAENNIDVEFGDENVPAAQYPDREVDYILIHDFLYRPPFETTEDELLHGDTEVRIKDCPGYYDKFPKLKKAVPESSNSDFPSSECEKIRVRHDYYWSLCMREHKKNHFRTHDCPNILYELRRRYVGLPRSNRQLSQFILKRLGWKDASQIKSSDTRWPIFFLHKMLLKKYEAYEYLKVLNKALEMTDIRVHHRAEYFLSTHADP